MMDEELYFTTACLGLINDGLSEPAITSQVDIDRLSSRSDSRIMSLKHELSITQALAFLSNYTDSPFHVTAVCVEEQRDGQGVLIRLTANMGDHPVLLEKLREMASILENEAVREERKANNRSNLLHAVVSLNQNRILCRLRSKHKKSKKAYASSSKLKSSLGKRLLGAIQALQSCSTTPIVTETRRRLGGLANLCSKVEDMGSSDLTSLRGANLLIQLVEDFRDFDKEYSSELCNIGKSKTLRKKSPDWDENSTRQLQDQIQKIGHYATCCEEVLRVSRRYRCFSQTAVEFTAQFQQTVKGPVLQQSFLTKNSGLLGRIRVKRQRAGQGQNIAKQVREDMAGIKRLHAEIQLVLFYELNPDRLAPRVLGSSKCACFLCHAFIKLHGRYIVPSTHGKVYPSWKWPGGILDSWKPVFLRVVEARIQVCLETSRRTCDPRESIVHLNHMLTPSVLSRVTGSLSSAASSVATVGPYVGFARYRSDGSSSSSTINSVVATVEHGSSSSEEDDASIVKYSERNVSNLENNINNSSMTVQQSSVALQSRLGRSSPFSGIMSTEYLLDAVNNTLDVEVPESFSPSTVAGPGSAFNLCLETDHGFPQRVGNQTSEVCTSKLPSLRVAVEMMTHGSSSSDELVIDIDSIDGEMFMPDSIMHSSGGLLLRRGGLLLRLRVVSD